MRPKVSVIIPTYQRGYLVGQAIESVLAQTYADYEIIVIDDASTDNTMVVLDGFKDRIKIIHLEENRSVGAARNAGILASQGDYVAFLDSDDLWVSEKLRKQIDLFRTNTNIGLVYSDFSYFDENGIEPSTSFEKNGGGKRGTIHRDVFMGGPISTLTATVRRTCLDKVGLFDETLPACEDLDMWLRITASYQVDFVNEPLSLYRFSPNQLHKYEGREKTLLGRLGARKKAYMKSYDIRHLDRTILDKCFFNEYLELALIYIEENKMLAARQVLNQYAQMRGCNYQYVRHWILSYFPAPILNITKALRPWIASCLPQPILKITKELRNSRRSKGA